MLKFLPFIFFFFSNSLFSQSLNEKEISIDNDEIKFAFTGHLYGEVHAAPHVCRSIINGIDTLNSLGLDFFISLGDLIQYQEINLLNQFKQQFIKTVNFPLFNAVGNHDLLTIKNNLEAYNYTFYKQNFTSKTWFKFTLNNNLFLILDTEINQSYILNEQKKFFENVIDSLLTTPPINVFLFTHKEIQFYKNNFKSFLIPKLKSLGSNIFIINGDAGKNNPLTYFYKEDSITYIQSHIKNNSNDGVILATIDRFNNVNFDLIPLNFFDNDSLQLNPLSKPAIINKTPQQEISKKTILILVLTLIIVVLIYNSLKAKRNV